MIRIFKKGLKETVTSGEDDISFKSSKTRADASVQVVRERLDRLFKMH